MGGAREEDLSAALDRLAETFTAHLCLVLLAPQMTCEEADALASVLRLSGHAEQAHLLIDFHARTDWKMSDMHNDIYRNKRERYEPERFGAGS